MYYTKINQENCIACGLCQIISPALFDFTPDGIAFTRKDDNKGITPVSSEEMDVFRKAYQQCPTGAILRSEEPFERQA